MKLILKGERKLYLKNKTFKGSEIEQGNVKEKKKKKS
jgi:hypothetical protein